MGMDDDGAGLNFGGQSMSQSQFWAHRYGRRRLEKEASLWELKELASWRASPWYKGGAHLVSACGVKVISANEV